MLTPSVLLLQDSELLLLAGLVKTTIFISEAPIGPSDRLLGPRFVNLVGLTRTIPIRD